MHIEKNTAENKEKTAESKLKMSVTLIEAKIFELAREFKDLKDT